MQHQPTVLLTSGGKPSRIDLLARSGEVLETSRIQAARTPGCVGSIIELYASLTMRAPGNVPIGPHLRGFSIYPRAAAWQQVSSFVTAIVALWYLFRQLRGLGGLGAAFHAGAISAERGNAAVPAGCNSSIGSPFSVPASHGFATLRTLRARAVRLPYRCMASVFESPDPMATAGR